MALDLARWTPAVLLFAACATAPATGPGAPVSPEVEVAAGLLRLEDRREYDAAALESAAASPDPMLRRRAALAAGRIGDRRAVGLLSRLTADADTSVAASAAFALGELGDSTGVPALIPLLTAERIATSPTVMGEAALALGKIPASRAGRQAVENLLRTAPRSGPGVQHAVGQALLAVWRFPRPADISPIVPWLDNADPELRWRAVYALTRRPSPDATRAAYPRSSDAEPLAQSFAMRALTRPLADSSGVGISWGSLALINGTRDSLHLVSVNAARSLGTYAEQDAVERLVELLRGGDDYLAITAAESLGRLGTRVAWTSSDLVSVALDTERPVFLRTTALASLAEVKPGELILIADALMRESGWRQRAAAARAYAAARAWDRIVDLANDADGRLAGAALDAAITEVGDSIDLIRGLVLRGLEHPDAVVRTNALGGVARLADPSTIPLVLDAYARAQGDSLLNDAALGAIDALGAIRRKEPAVGPAFFARFQRSNDYLVRQRVAAVFGDTLAAAWGAPLPIETGRTLDDYQSLAQASMATPLRRARIVTDRGEIEVELFNGDAPLTVENFLNLARRGYFNGQEWPRVGPNFVIQWGDPRGDTSGGPGYAIRDEINRHPYGYGTLGMALSGPDTGGSQWFITHSPQPHLDGGYTVFGRVTRGMDVVGRILPGDRILRIEEVR